jgi:hypothetical protein
MAPIPCERQASKYAHQVLMDHLLGRKRQACQYRRFDFYAVHVTLGYDDADVAHPLGGKCAILPPGSPDECCTFGAGVDDEAIMFCCDGPVFAMHILCVILTDINRTVRI